MLNVLSARAVLVFLLAAAPSAIAATSLEVVVPNTSTTGVPFQFTVTARTGAAVDTTYTGTVHFTSTEASAALPPDYTFTLADAGTHAFSATMNRAGEGPETAQHTIAATDTVSASVHGSDVTVVNWNDSLVRWFFVDAPDVVERTVPYEIEVRAMNAAHSVVPGYTGTVRFEGQRGEQVPPDYTFTPADAGVRTFTITATLGDSSSVVVENLSDPEINGNVRTDVVCPELVASATNSGPICGNGASILFGNANLPVINYYWASTVGHPPRFESVEQNPTVGNAGTYVLTVRQANGCSANAQTTVTVHQPETPQVTLSAEALCGPGNVTATLTNAASFSNIQWSADGGTIVSGQGTASIEVAPDSGTSSISLLIEADETSSGCYAYRNIDTVPVGGATSADITTVSVACPQSTQTASVPDGGPGTSYAWSIANGSITNGHGTRTIQYAPNGNGNVTLDAIVTKGSCSATDTAIVPVNGPTALVDADLAVCDATEVAVQVTLAGTPPFHVVWSDGVVQDNVAGTSTTRTLNESGAYWITQLSDANCNGTASGIAEIFIGDAPEIITEPESHSVKTGQSATLSVTAEGSDLRYRWYEGRSGDRSRPVSGAGEPSLNTPPLTRTTSFWVEVRNDCGSAASHAAVIAVGGSKRRAARH